MATQWAEPGEQPCPGAQIISIVPRFFDKVSVEPAPPHLDRPCLIWTGARSQGGNRPCAGHYGKFWLAHRGGGVLAHIVAAWMAGLIDRPRMPKGMTIDHRCERTLCVEPTHFLLVPAAANIELYHARRRARELAARDRMTEALREEVRAATG